MANLDFEYDYATLISQVMDMPERKTRNSVTKSMFGVQFTLDTLSQDVVPLLSGRKMYWKGIVGETATFLQEPQDIEDFRENGCNYWDKWAKEDGSIELDYGNAWFDFNGVNQVENVVKSLQEDPHGRRHLITSWRPDRLPELDLPCCHYAYQFYVRGDKLDMIWIQRSVDVMVGLPSNFMNATILLLLMAQTVGLKAGKITMQLGDVHIYEEHFYLVGTYIRQLSAFHGASNAKYKLDKKATVFNFTPDMFEVYNYEYMKAINFEVIA